MTVKVMPVKSAPRGTPISVATLIIPKAFRRIDVPLLVVAQAAAQVAHVRTNALARQGNEVRARAIFAVRYHRLWFAGGVFLVLLDQLS